MKIRIAETKKDFDAVKKLEKQARESITIVRNRFDLTKKEVEKANEFLKNHDCPIRNQTPDSFYTQTFEVIFRDSSIVNMATIKCDCGKKIIFD